MASQLDGTSNDMAMDNTIDPLLLEQPSSLGSNSGWMHLDQLFPEDAYSVGDLYCLNVLPELECISNTTSHSSIEPRAITASIHDGNDSSHDRLSYENGISGQLHLPEAGEGLVPQLEVHCNQVLPGEPDPTASRNAATSHNAPCEDSDKSFLQRMMEGVAASLSSTHISPLSSFFLDQAGSTSATVSSDVHGNETDSSWDEQDAVETFYASLRKGLRGLRENSCPVLITSPLPVKLRRVVHSAAHLQHCSHISLGTGRQRRMLLSRFRITSYARLHTKKKCCNGLNESIRVWPTILRMWITSGTTAHANAASIIQIMQAKNIPRPRACRCEYEDGSEPCYAEFEDSGQALEAMELLQGSHCLSGNTFELKVTFLTAFAENHIDPFGLNDFSNWDLYTSRALSNDLPQFIDCESPSWLSTSAIPSFLSSITSSLRMTQIEPIQRATSQLRGKTPVQRRDNSSGRSSIIDDGYYSANSSASGTSFKRSHSTYSGDEPSDADQEASANKRKKHPKIRNGYVCQYGCGMAFDCYGYRTKHEKNHAPKESRPHKCSDCGMGFINRKDLTRHETTHRDRDRS